MTSHTLPSLRTASRGRRTTLAVASAHQDKETG